MSITMSVMNKLFGGALKFVGGVGSGLIRGIGYKNIPRPGGLSGRLGGVVGSAGGGVLRAAGIATGKTAEKTGEKILNFAKKTYSNPGDIADNLGKKASKLGNFVKGAGADVANRAGTVGRGAVGLHRLTTKPVYKVDEAGELILKGGKPVLDRNLYNAFTGRRPRPLVGAGMEIAAIGLAVGIGLNQARDQLAHGFGPIHGYGEDRMADALSYDGVENSRSPIHNMGGTGDLVTALHANRHG